MGVCDSKHVSTKGHSQYLDDVSPKSVKEGAEARAIAREVSKAQRAAGKPRGPSNRTEQNLKQAMLRDVFDLMDMDDDDRLMVETEVKPFVQYIPDKRDRDNFYDSFRRLGGAEEILSRATWLKFHRNHTYREVCRFYEQLLKNCCSDICTKVWAKLDLYHEGRISEAGIHQFVVQNFTEKASRAAQEQLLQDLMTDDEGTEYLLKEHFLEYMAGCSPASLRTTYGFVLGNWAVKQRHETRLAQMSDVSPIGGDKETATLDEASCGNSHRQLATARDSP